MAYEFMDYGFIEDNMLPHGTRSARMSLTPESPVRFRPGRVTITDAARRVCTAVGRTAGYSYPPENLLAMHVRGLWGNGVNCNEEEANEAVLQAGSGRVLSAYALGDEVREADFYVYTDLSPAGGNATVVCLQEEYGW